MKASFSALADIPISLWYLTFYCNPAIQLAVANKIFISGLTQSAALYGAFIEKYLHTEEIYQGDPKQEAWTDLELEGRGWSYDVSSPVNVVISQIVHLLCLPVSAMKEIYIPLKHSLVRDWGK